MPFARASRRLIVLVVAACVVFAETAALASGCAIERAGGVPAAAEPPCPSHAQPVDDAAAGNVCEVHCQAATLPVDAAWQLAPALASTVVIPLHVVPVRSVQPLPPVPRGTPPPFLRTSRLLI
jgi:hypothetical protein